MKYVDSGRVASNEEVSVSEVNSNKNRQKAVYFRQRVAASLERKEGAGLRKGNTGGVGVSWL